MRYLNRGTVIQQFRPNRAAAPDREVAEQLRETFVDRPVEKVEQVRWHWPTELLEIGACEAVMYCSDKWHRKGQYEDYKHIAEGPQRLSVASGFLRDFETDPSGRTELAIPSVPVEIDGRMPDSFAVLAPLLGFQCRLYELRPNGDLVLPAAGEDLYQVDTDPDAVTLGAAKHPETGATFLVVYDCHRVLAMITGDQLDVLKDGITG